MAENMHNRGMKLNGENTKLWRNGCEMALMQKENIISVSNRQTIIGG